MIPISKAVDPTRLARLVTVATWIWLAVDALLGLSGLVAVALRGGLSIPAAPVARLRLLDSAVDGLGVASTVASAAAAASILRWIYVVNRNAHALGGTLTITPVSNVVWFFLPVGNLWKPFTGVRESWQATLNPTAPEKVPVPAVMRYCWAAWLINGLGSIVSVRFPAPAATVEQVIGTNWTLALSTPTDVVLVLTLLAVVRRLSGLQTHALAAARRAGGDAPSPVTAAGAGPLAAASTMIAGGGGAAEVVVHRG